MNANHAQKEKISLEEKISHNDDRKTSLDKYIANLKRELAFIEGSTYEDFGSQTNYEDAKGATKCLLETAETVRRIMESKGQ